MKLNRRWIPAGKLALVLGALAAGVSFAHYGLAQLAAVRHEAANASRTLAAAEQQLAMAQAHAFQVEQATHLVEQVRRQGLQPEHWGERRINLRAVSTSRAEADHLLRETAMNRRHLFVAENYEISVLDAQGGLFDAPGQNDRGLNLSLRGAFYARDPEKQ